jgi:hypothetical protein
MMFDVISASGKATSTRIVVGGAKLLNLTIHGSLMLKLGGVFIWSEQASCKQNFEFRGCICTHQIQPSLAPDCILIASFLHLLLGRQQLWSKRILKLLEY